MRERKKLRWICAIIVLCNTLIPAIGNPVYMPQFLPGGTGRNIRHLPCVSRRTGETGVCMFAFTCVKANGTHLGTCIDRFYFGSCCKLDGESDIYPQDNTIDDGPLKPFITSGGHGTTDNNNVPAYSPKPAASTTKLPVRTTDPPVRLTEKPSTTRKPVKVTEQPSSTTIRVTESKPTLKPLKGVTKKPIVDPTTESFGLSTFQTVQNDSHEQSTKPTVSADASSPRPVQPTTVKRPFRPSGTTTTVGPPKPSQRPIIENTTKIVLNQSDSTIISSTPTSGRPTTYRPVAATTGRPTTYRPVAATTGRPVLTSTQKPINVTRFPPRNTTTSTVVRPTRPNQTPTRRPIITTTKRTSLPVRRPTTTSRTPTITTQTPRPVATTTTKPSTLTSSERPSASTERPVGTTVRVTVGNRPTAAGNKPSTVTEKNPVSASGTRTPPTQSVTSGGYEPSTTGNKTPPSTVTTAGPSATTAKPTSTTGPASLPPKPSTTTGTTGKPIVTSTTLRPRTTTEKVKRPTVPVRRPTITTQKPSTTTRKPTERPISTTTRRPSSTLAPPSTRPPANTTVLSNEVLPLDDTVPNKVDTIGPEMSNGQSTSQAPGLVTWTSNSDEISTKSPDVTSSSSAPEEPTNTDWTPITTPDGWILIQSPTPDGQEENEENLTIRPITKPTKRPTTTGKPTTGSTTTTERMPTKPTLSTVLSTIASVTMTTDSSIPSETFNMSDYKQVCGRRLFPESRIVGGQRSAFGKWPWQISLRQWRTSTYLHKCGAALLNENWAITAAHCVENVPPSDLLLRIGEHDLASEDEPYGFQERRVQIVASHPQFDPRTFEYDLALLRFYEPLHPFQPNALPICLPDDDANYVGLTAHVTGWGRLYEDGPLPSVLQEVSVPVINNTACEAMYRSAGYIEHIPKIFICAGWRKGGYDSCEGDSGGPMVIQRPRDKRWILAGVISWGIGCAEPNQPGVYTRISEFREWINQILQF